jgi:hypothetical protein
MRTQVTPARRAPEAARRARSPPQLIRRGRDGASSAYSSSRTSRSDHTCVPCPAPAQDEPRACGAAGYGAGARGRGRMYVAGDDAEQQRALHHGRVAPVGLLSPRPVSAAAPRRAPGGRGEVAPRLGGGSRVGRRARRWPRTPGAAQARYLARVTTLRAPHRTCTRRCSREAKAARRDALKCGISARFAGPALRRTHLTPTASWDKAFAMMTSWRPL